MAKKPRGRAKRSQINPLVIEYLTQYPSRLIKPHQFGSDLTPTPRAWERVSRNLDQLQKLSGKVQEQLAPDLFSGDLGTEIGVSFAEFVQARGVRLKVSDMINQAGLEADFQQLEEADKLSLLREWVRKYPETLAQNSGAANFSSYLTDISPDGQYSLIRQVGEDDELLNKMYNTAKENPAGAVAELYETGAQIATYGDRGE